MVDEAREKAQTWVQSLEKPSLNFVLGPIIGYGDSSVVREATDPDGRTVAVKIQEETEDSILLLYNEFQTLSEVCCGNPKFPIFFGAFRTVEAMPHQIWFAMELCEEGSVQDLLVRLQTQERVLKEDIIAFILREVLLGLKDLHELSIIHRDVKAANILITSNGDIKLCDFGLVKRVESPEGKSQEVIGSPYWMAPEVVVADRHPELAYDSRADVWSLGVTAIELGDCEAPNAHVFPPRVVFQTVQNPPPTLKKPADWSQLFSDFISECLEKNPDHRPWSAELIEHTFINEEVLDREARIKGSLVQLLNELRGCSIPQPTAEVTVKSEMIKMDRNSAPQPMYRDDLATLYTVSEDSVMETLSQRFSQGNIYTFVGDVLLIVNPFNEYPIYGAEVANKYKYRARCDNAPHIYAVGDRAYQDMLHHQEVQNIVLTGETGSGKTSAAKHLLWHLANMTANNNKMIERMLKVSTVMEAFGNASTIFNPNSTRHIQYFELTFTKTGKLSGGILWAYCLEKWRVTNCGRNQSNFHIFYYLMDTLIATGQTEKYHLDKGKNYEYLPPSPSHTPQVNIEKLREVKEAFNVLDFSLDEQETIVKILCAILLIGQIHYKGEDEAEIQNPEVVEKIAELLQLDDKKLKWTFTNYCVVTGGESVRGKNNFDEAEETRDSLARSLYCRLVDWIVNLINTKLSFTRLVFGDQNSLSILDIPGFECFAQENTLDQFLVNMTNEQMQFFYNQRVFIWEMQDYEKDELPQIGYNFHDNHELLDIVLSKPNGLLSFLDDETKSNNDHQRLLDQINNKLETRFIKVADENTFTVFHYSGQVNYDARNFVERNKNFLSPETIQVLRASENNTVTQLFMNQLTKTGNLTMADEDVKQTRWTSALSAKPHQQKRFNTKSRGKYSQSRQMQTIGATMRHSLLEMLQKASQGSAHFVRCIRSNLKCAPFTFDRDLIRYQMRALGILDTIRARQLGYSRRLKFSEFLRRYKFLAFDFEELVEETKDNCRLLLIRLKMEGWALGNSKVFLKYYNEEFLSRLYETQVHKVVKIQSLMRAFLARKKTNCKFPRLAELRKQGRDTISPEKELKIIQKSLTEAGKKPKAPGSTVVGQQARHSTGVLEVRQYEDSRRYSSNSTAASTPEPRMGYNSVYASSNSYGNGSKNYNRPGYSGGGQSYAYNNRGPSTAPLKPIRRSLSPEVELPYERPVSPRDIAKVFETKAMENREIGMGARYKHSISSPSTYLLKRPVSPGDYQRSRNLNYDTGSGGSSRSRENMSPDIINPLEEFTNYANSMISGNHDEPGPFNFQGLLRKTNSNMKQAGSQEVLYQSKNSVPDTNRNSTTTSEEGQTSMRHCSSNPYPLPGMTPNSDRSHNNSRSEPEQPKSKPLSTYQSRNEEMIREVPEPKPRQKSIHSSGSRDSIKDASQITSITIAPGLVIEGFVEDL